MAKAGAEQVSEGKVFFSQLILRILLANLWASATFGKVVEQDQQQKSGLRSGERRRRKRVLSLRLGRQQRFKGWNSLRYPNEGLRVGAHEVNICRETVAVEKFLCANLFSLGELCSP